MGRIRWGILGTGSIARRFADGISHLEEVDIAAVGSRHEHSANRFGQDFKIQNRHEDYAALVADPDVDVVYVATPHVCHKEHAALCLNKGKAVLCEKPLTVNAEDARELINLARDNNLFLMEGMWTRFFPLMVRLRALISEGVIGEPRMLTADFGIREELNPSGRKFNLALGGGALLDVGVYCVSLACMMFGKPQEVTGCAYLGQTGVDEQSAAVLKYSNGQLAILSAAIRTRTPQEATIIGTEDYIRINQPWWRPHALSVIGPTGKADVVEANYIGNGFAHEALEVQDCLQRGLLESSTMPLTDSLSTIEVMDELRRQWNLSYPLES
jgi:predicted dehydrogenase